MYNNELPPPFSGLDLAFLPQDYEQDGIDWTKVDFIDNQDCLNLFEKVSSLLYNLHA